MSPLFAVTLLLLVTLSLSPGFVTHIDTPVDHVLCHGYFCIVVACARAILAGTRRLCSFALHPLNVSWPNRSQGALSLLASELHNAPGLGCWLIIRALTQVKRFAPSIAANASYYFHLFLRLLGFTRPALITASSLLYRIAERSIQFAHCCACPCLRFAGPMLWILLNICVYSTLCLAPALVLYLVVNNVLDETVGPREDVQPRLAYAIHRRRKPMRMQIERWNREREDAMKQASKRVPAIADTISPVLPAKASTRSINSTNDIFPSLQPPSFNAPSSDLLSKASLDEYVTFTPEPTNVAEEGSCSYAPLVPPPVITPSITLASCLIPGVTATRLPIDESDSASTNPSTSTSSDNNILDSALFALGENLFDSIAPSRNAPESDMKRSLDNILATSDLEPSGHGSLDTTGSASTLEPVSSTPPGSSLGNQNAFRETTTPHSPSTASLTFVSPLSASLSLGSTLLTPVSSPDALDHVPGRHIANNQLEDEYKLNYELEPSCSANELGDSSEPHPSCESFEDAPPISGRREVSANPVDASTPHSGPSIPMTETDAQCVPQFEPEFEALVGHMDIFDPSSQAVQDFLASPGVAELMESAALELDSRLANGTIDPLLWTAGQTFGAEDAALNSTPFAMDGASDASIQTAGDIVPDITPEQAEAILKQLDAELARPYDGFTTPDFGPCSSAPIPAISPAPKGDFVYTSAPHGTPLQVLDAAWTSFGPISTGPQNTSFDPTTPMGPAGNLSVTTEVYFDPSTFAPSDYPSTTFPTPPAHTNLEALGLDLNFDMQLSDEDCLAALEQLRMDTSDIDFESILSMPGPSSTNLSPPSIPAASNSDGWDTSMTNEDCLAQLEELCKHIVPAADLEVDLERTLAMLGGLGIQDGAGSGSCTNTSTQANVVDPTSSGERMQLDDIIDSAMMLEPSAELDIDERMISLGEVSASRAEPMDVDGVLMKAAWKNMEEREGGAMCPVDICIVNTKRRV